MRSYQVRAPLGQRTVRYPPPGPHASSEDPDEEDLTDDEEDSGDEDDLGTDEDSEPSSDPGSVL